MDTLNFKDYIFTVSEFITLIKDAIEGAFPHVLIKGEISNLKVYLGHIFFTLKDEQSQLRCVLYKGYTRSLKFKPKDGMSVLVQGQPSIYKDRGEFQIIVRYMEPLGIGALKIAYEELKKKLAEKGYFDESRKKPIPAFPQTIGIITSPRGAAIRDILNILNRRFSNLHIIIFPVKVQGEGAAKEIAEAIAFANCHFADKIDVLILARGGGSFEDLFPFSEECVADAIYYSKIPLISAVGHETDFSIADFVADLRAPTPSAAAELVIKKKDEFLSHIYHLFKRATILIKRHLTLLQRKVENERRLLRSPQSILTQKRLKLIDYESNLYKAIKNQISKRKERVISLEKHLDLLSPITYIKKMRTQLQLVLNQLLKAINVILLKKKESYSYTTGKLEMLSPLKILSRGYSITMTLDGKIIKDAEELHLGSELKTKLNKGAIISVVKEKILD